MKEEILEKAIEKLETTKNEIQEKIITYEEQIANYKESNKDLEDNLSVEVYNERTDKLMQNLKACETIKENASYYHDKFKEQRDIILKIKNYNLTLGDINEFYDLIGLVEGIRGNEMYIEFQKFSKPTQVLFPFKSSELTEVNNIIGFSLIKVDSNSLNSFQYIGNNYAQKAKEVQKSLSTPKLTNFYDKMIKFFADVIKQIDFISKESGEEIQKIRDAEIKRRKDEIKDNIDEINRKIDECKNSLASIEDIYTLYEEYKNTGSQKVLIKLTDELMNLVIISQRESKIMKYIPTEKEEIPVIPEVEVSPVIEEKEPLIKTEIDNDYFRNPNTKCLMCFLGDEKDSIMTDIENHFDNSARGPVYNELNDLFNSLTTEKEYIADKGGNPHSGSSKKALTLLTRPFDFEYRRFGVRNDKFRIHAILRHSSLLEELNFGNGNIMFFGAVGVNDDKQKSDAYNRLGKRAVAELSKAGGPVRLRPNFDYIEHITRRYIPKNLLSEEDLAKASNGIFNSKARLNNSIVDKAIERGRYFLYDALDDKSKANVKSYIEDYLINQTNILFEIKDQIKKAKGNALD